MLAALALVAAMPSKVGAHEVSASDWIAVGERVHGGYGSLIALGVRIGLDARERLSAQPRDLDVTYFDGEKTPCACVVDGILIATSASPGQGSLRVSAERDGTRLLLTVYNDGPALPKDDAALEHEAQRVAGLGQRREIGDAFVDVVVAVVVGR